MGYNQNIEKRGYTAKKDYGPRKNEWIRVPQVQLIGAEGENLGVVETERARIMAQEAGLDLVEVGATANPPVCRIMDFSKYIYQQNKKKRVAQNKSKTKELKEFRFTPVMDIGDKEHRVKRALEFLQKGHPVKLTMVKRGRQSMEITRTVFNEILTNFADFGSIEAEPRTEGNRISITYRNGKTKNKQNSEEEDKAI
jgi:translation initiation factor IF-3